MEQLLFDQGNQPVRSMRARGLSRFVDDPLLLDRLDRVRAFSSRVRASEYHLTNACNIRCKGCWFFEYEFEKAVRENTSMEALIEHILRERERGVNAPLLIGGEPTLFLDRIEKYVELMEFVTISTNGLKPMPRQGFENVNVFITLFGGGPLDDEMRAIKPNGKRFTQLFETSLSNYKNDDRVTFVYALAEHGIQYIEDTVRRIADNGNQVNFNYYTDYTADDKHAVTNQALLEAALRVKEKYPDTVVSTDYYIQTLITGKSHWGEQFGYATCPSISVDHPAHKERLAKGHKSLPLFNTYAPDLKTINFCCTSGHCDGCRDSQAVYSWLLMSAGKFMRDKELTRKWVEVAEAYWKQFVWSPYH